MEANRVIHFEPIKFQMIGAICLIHTIILAITIFTEYQSRFCQQIESQRNQFELDEGMS